LATLVAREAKPLEEGGPFCSWDSEMSGNVSRIARCVAAFPEEPSGVFQAARTFSSMYIFEIQAWLLRSLRLNGFQ
jgi:hypothetical protein